MARVENERRENWTVCYGQWRRLTEVNGTAPSACLLLRDAGDAATLRFTEEAERLQRRAVEWAHVAPVWQKGTTAEMVEVLFSMGLREVWRGKESVTYCDAPGAVWVVLASITSIFNTFLKGFTV